MAAYSIKNRLFPLLLLLFLSPLLTSQALESELFFQSNINFPLGPVVDNDLPLYDTGGGVTLQGELYHSGLSWLYMRPHLSFDLLPLNGNDTALTVLAPGLSLGFRLSPASRLVFKAYGGAGIYYGQYEMSQVVNPYYQAGGEVALKLTPSLVINLGASYRQLTTPSGSLHEGVSAGVGLGVDLRGREKSRGMIIYPNLKPIYPLFYTYYDKNPAGSIKVKNPRAVRYENLRVSFQADQYMDDFKFCGEKEILRPGEEAEFPLYALFKDNIFRVTEGTKVSGRIKMEYTYLGKEMVQTEAVTVDINNRNAMTWDDDRKAAAFVTAKDPLVLSLSKNTVSLIRTAYSAPLSENFRTALALFQTMEVFGLGYAVDPSTPYVDFSSNEGAVDFLQFPNQTLSFRAGDCDDLSVLYAALLESVGIPAAFVTTPGHIYIAFDLGLSEKDGARFFDVERDVIVHNDRVWLPVEVTLVKEGFMRAWRRGVQEWNQGKEVNQAALYPVQEAWELYEPVGFSEGGMVARYPEEEGIFQSYTRELSLFYDFIVGPQVAQIHAACREKGLNEVETANRIAVFYAQIGMFDKAKGEFESLLERERHVPSLVNLGNIFYIEGKGEEALALYREAFDLKPLNPVILYRIVDLHYTRREYEEADAMLSQLKERHPDLAGSVLAKHEDSGDTRASEGDRITLDDWWED
ncbi:MAG: tetratricopeptide repeat protein [Spirochaetales bacterium]|nr:tetratricopeptide repeat protein [Spirochaetales bacterium]